MAFNKTQYHLGEPIFLVEYPNYYSDGRSAFKVARTFSGLKAMLKARTRRGQEVFVCTNPTWVKLPEVSDTAVAAMDEETVNAELEQIRLLYEKEASR